MIPNQEKTINISGSSNLAESRSQQMGLDSASLPHLMRVLTNLYSDPEMAVIREYSTNAYDSHVEAGKANVPIHITLPTVFSSEFVVRDFGVGMSEEEVFNVFGLYGASTKRESNEYVGQLGLGCKSGLTLTNQFSLTAIKDGYKRVFSVHLDEYGIGKITKLHEERTDSGNGVEISIPVKNVHSFNKKARLFYRFFPVLPTFVGGVAFPDELVPQTILTVDNNVRVIKSVSEDENKDYIVMGGVAYPYRNYTERPVRSGTVVIEAPIGAVDFTPSREELHLTKRTSTFIESQYEQIRSKLRKQIQAKLDAAKDVWEFQKVVSEFNWEIRNLKVSSMSYKGIQFGLFDGHSLPFPEGSISYYIENKRIVLGKPSVNKSNIKTTAVVINDEDSGNVSTYNRGKIKSWIISSEANVVIVIPSTAKILDELKGEFFGIYTLKELKKSVNNVPATKKTKLYDRCTSTWYKNIDFTAQVPEDNVLIYYAPKKALRENIQAVKVALELRLPVYSVSAPQEKNFREAYPLAKPLHEWFIIKAKETLELIKKETDEISLFVLGCSFHSLENSDIPYNILSPKGIDDPELRYVLKMLNARSSHSLEIAGLKSKFDKYIVHAGEIMFEVFGHRGHNSLTVLRDECATLGKGEVEKFNKVHKLMYKKYPLILTRRQQEEHLIQYANLVAKGEQK